MSEWKTYRLGDICQVLNGRAYKQEELLNQGPYPVLRVGNILQGNNWYYSDLELPDDKYCYNGDLLYAWSCGFAPYIWKGKKSIYHYHIWKLKENSQIIDKLFFYYYLIIHTKYNLGGTHGSVMLHLTKKDFENQTLHLPPLDEQRRIAGILGSLDDKIELNRRLNANLEAQAQALFRSWFVDFEPFRDGPFVDSQLGKIPQGWKVETLSNLATVIKKGITPSNSETYSHYSIPAYDDAHFPEKQSGETIKSGKYIVYNNSILLSKLNPRIKRLWFIKTAEENAICSTEFIPIQTKDTELISFVFYLIDSDIFYQQALSLVNGATGSHQRFHAEDIMQIPFAWNKDAAIDFAQKATCFLQKIEDNIRENQTLSALRDTLLPKLMAGEISC